MTEPDHRLYGHSTGITLRSAAPTRRRPGLGWLLGALGVAAALGLAAWLNVDLRALPGIAP